MWAVCREIWQCSPEAEVCKWPYLMCVSSLHALRAPGLTCLLFHHAILRLLLVEGQRQNDGSTAHTRFFFYLLWSLYRRQIKKKDKTFLLSHSRIPSINPWWVLRVGCLLIPQKICLLLTAWCWHVRHRWILSTARWMTLLRLTLKYNWPTSVNGSIILEAAQMQQALLLHNR